MCAQVGDLVLLLVGELARCARRGGGAMGQVRVTATDVAAAKAACRSEAGGVGSQETTLDQGSTRGAQMAVCLRRGTEGRTARA